MVQMSKNKRKTKGVGGKEKVISDYCYPYDSYLDVSDLRYTPGHLLHNVQRSTMAA
jgi:hypothetical protein